MTGIMRALRNNLDGKSRQFEDAALTQLFLMNNVYYIVRNFRRFGSASSPRISLKQNQNLTTCYLRETNYLFTGKKQRIFWVMIWFKHIEESYNNTQNSTRQFPGIRFEKFAL